MEQTRSQFDEAILAIQNAGSELNRALNTATNDATDTSAPSYRAPQPLVPHHATLEAHRARQSILTSSKKLETLLRDPSEFLQQLIVQNQILACLQWLAKFQVLACIPLKEDVLLSDVADLAGVPEIQIARVVRMTATAGFLHEPRPGYIAHTALSAQFLLRPALFDAVNFASEIGTPISLSMPVVTEMYGESQLPEKSAYSLVTKETLAGPTAWRQRPKVRRELSAFKHLGASNVQEDVEQLFSCLNWSALGEGLVVETGAHSESTAVALVKMYPRLSVIVQIAAQTGRAPAAPWFNLDNVQTGAEATMYDTQTLGQTLNGRSDKSHNNNNHHNNHNVVIQQRVLGTPQTIRNAAVYILHIPSPSATSSTASAASQVAAELRAHLSVLHERPTTVLIAIVWVLPDPGTVDLDVEAMARMRDLCLYQFTSQRGFDMRELYDIIRGVNDDVGRLVVANRVVSPRSPYVVLELRYEAQLHRTAHGARERPWTFL